MFSNVLINRENTLAGFENELLVMCVNTPYLPRLHFPAGINGADEQIWNNIENNNLPWVLRPVATFL